MIAIMNKAMSVNNQSSRFLSRLSRLQWLLLIIPLAYVLLLLVNPITGFFKLSFYDESGFTLEYLKKVLTERSYVKIIGTTLNIALLVTIFSFLLGYPVAYLMAQTKSSKWKRIIFFAVLIPFWISLLIRTFSWLLLLSDNGVINGLLMKTGIVDEPIKMLFVRSSVVIGMTHVLIPYMILSLYSIMESIDNQLVDAARSMGASPLRAFLQVYFPLSLPGALAGSVLVFIQGIGFFITPAILGGRKDIMLSLLIQDNMLITLNWNLASALALVLFVIVLVLLGLSALVLRKTPVLKDVM